MTVMSLTPIEAEENAGLNYQIRSFQKFEILGRLLHRESPRFQLSKFGMDMGRSRERHETKGGLDNPLSTFLLRNSKGRCSIADLA